MNLKPNQHKRIFFNTKTTTSLAFIGLPPKILGPLLKLIFCSVLRQLFCSEIFRFPLKLACYLQVLNLKDNIL